MGTGYQGEGWEEKHWGEHNIDTAELQEAWKNRLGFYMCAQVVPNPTIRPPESMFLVKKHARLGLKRRADLQYRGFKKGP